MTASTHPPRSAFGAPEPPDLVFSRDFSPGLLAASARHGELVGVAGGVYVPRVLAGEEPWQSRDRLVRSRAHAVAAALPAHLALTGVHAAVLFGAPVPYRDVEVRVVGAGASSRVKGPRFYRRHRRALQPEEVVLRDGVRVTSVARTAVECARFLPPYEALPVVDGLLHAAARVDRRDPEGSARRLGDLRAQIDEILAREPRTPGNHQARVTLTYADGRAESPLESEARAISLFLGLPMPDLQRHVRVRGRDYYPDMTWEFVITEADGSEWRLVIHLECDGLSKYEGGSSLEDERARADALRSLGHVVLHATSRQLRRDGAGWLRQNLLPLLPDEVRRSLRPVRMFGPQWRPEPRADPKPRNRH